MKKSKQREQNTLLPTKEQVERFERLHGLLSSILADVAGFSKKKPDGVMNKLKVDMINKVLKQIKDFFSSDPVVEFLELLDDEILPTNSDALLMLGQFSSAIGRYKGKFYGRDVSDMSKLIYRWFTKENPPKKEQKTKRMVYR